MTALRDELVVVDQGTGAPVILVHGFALTHELWGEQQVLADEFRLISYDTRGCGGSPAPETGYDTSDLADELLALMDSLGLAKAHLVGHSRGGIVTLDVALRHPERVASLVFISSGLVGFPYSDEFIADWREARHLARKNSLSAAIDHWLEGGALQWAREHRPEVFELVEGMMRRYSGADWLDRATYREPDPPPMERLSEVQAPTFVLSGQEDLHDFVEIANMLTWWIPGARQKSLLGVGHFPMLENPYETNLYLRAFLRTVAAEKEI